MLLMFYVILTDNLAAYTCNTIVPHRNDLGPAPSCLERENKWKQLFKERKQVNINESKCTFTFIPFLEWKYDICALILTWFLPFKELESTDKSES